MAWLCDPWNAGICFPPPFLIYLKVRKARGWRASFLPRVDDEPHKIDTEEVTSVEGFSILSRETGLPAQEVHRRAQHARRTLGMAQGALNFWLLEIDERKLFQEFGCSSTFHNFARNT